MFFFGHIGVTSGIVRVCHQAALSRNQNNHWPHNDNSIIPKGLKTQPADRVTDIAGRIDYRLVMIGSMLPDIIDKPLWMVMSSYFPLAGRGYAHTFLFSFVLFISGVALVSSSKKLWLLLVSLCSFSHLALDEMWLNPVTLWWPLLGPIQPYDTEGWLFNVWQSLTSEPKIYVTEILGLAVFLYFGVKVIKNRKVIYFLKTGLIDW
jgi:inner membrane protein